MGFSIANKTVTNIQSKQGIGQVLRLGGAGNLRSIVYFNIVLPEGEMQSSPGQRLNRASPFARAIGWAKGENKIKVAFGSFLDDGRRTTADGSLKSIVYFKILLAETGPFKITEITQTCLPVRQVIKITVQTMGNFIDRNHVEITA